MKLQRFFYTGLIGLLLSCNLWLARPVLAAQELAVRFGFLEQSVPVADLRHYAETGAASNALKDFLRYVSRDKQLAFRAFLQATFPVDLVALDRVLNGTTGEKFLRQLADVDDRRDEAGVQAIRGALILGIQPKTGFSLLSILDAYPEQRLTINLSKAFQFVSGSVPQPPNDKLATIPAWQTWVEYQATVNQNQHYQGCLFGDSISSAVGNSLGEQRFNFAIAGMSSVSLIEQLKQLAAKHVQCETAIIEIGTNDAWYSISNAQFQQNLVDVMGQVRSLSAKQIYLLPAFYSTVAASKKPELAGTLERVDEINQLINQVATAEQVSIAAAAIQPLFDKKTLKESLTTDGVHLNEQGLAIYRDALVHLFEPNLGR